MINIMRNGMKIWMYKIIHLNNMVKTMTNWRNVFSWQVQPETPPVVHHISMQHDEQHHIDENNDEFKDISNEKFTNRWALVTCQDCIYGRMEDKLMNAHENAAARRNAEFLNYGWASGDDFIHSKTNRGKLYSEIDPETLRVTHSWDDDD